MQPSSHSRESWTLQFWLLTGFLILVFLTGGSSRVDVSSLVILRPASVLMCAVALATLRREHFEGRRWLLALAAAIIGLNLLHLVPLPPGIWQSLPGRADVAATDRLAGLGDIWRPLTLTPMNGWHALSALFAPLAVILLGVQLRRQERYALLLVVIGLGVASGILGLLQVIGGSQGPLYLYRLTNHGSAVGFFANRNHSAVLLTMLFPMLAVFAANPDGTADRQRGRRVLAVAVAAVLIPLILVSGSRSGLIFALVGLVSAALLYRRPPEGLTVRRGGRKFQITLLPVLAVVGLASLAILFIVFSRAEALDRLLRPNAADGSRSDFWQVSADLVWRYFPFGSGSGSFVEAFQILEPARILKLAYVNRAHNDWLEIAVTYGLPGLLLLAVALVAFLRRSVRVWSKGAGTGRATQFARLATVLIVMLGLASIPDYPARIPSMMCVAAIFLIWLAGPDQGGRNKSAGDA